MKYVALALTILTGLLTMMMLGGIMSMMVGLDDGTPIPIVIEGTDAYAEAKYEIIGYDLGGLIWTIICFALCSLCYTWYRKLSRKKKEVAQTEVREPFVLYLRSFVDDAKTSKMIDANRSEEELLMNVLSDVAPVYTIGDPKDVKMPLGAYRIYVDESQWKTVVRELMQRSVLVVFRLGKTDNFLWEVETALNSIPTSRMLFVVPESKNFSKVAYLYKLMLEHGIDIKNLDVSVEDKSRGSISSFVYFDDEGQPQTREVKVGRLSGFFISYENVLRNTLSEFRARFGLGKDSAPKRLRLTRIAALFTIFAVIFCCGARLFNDLVSLKYQMPYELVEKCVTDQAFVNTYSERVNGSNLTHSVIESLRGSVALTDEEFMTLAMIEAATVKQMKYGEIREQNKAPKNLLLMVKKYQPESYETYVELRAKSCLLAVNYPEEVNELLVQYQSRIDDVPEYLTNLLSSKDADPVEIARAFNEAIEIHAQDVGLADDLKTLLSLRFQQ